MDEKRRKRKEFGWKIKYWSEELREDRIEREKVKDLRIYKWENVIQS